MAEILNRVNSGLYIRPSKDSFGSFLETWLRDHIFTRVRPTTLDGYRWRARSIIKALGHHRLWGLEPQHIQVYHRSKLDEWLSSATIVKHHNHLSRIKRVSSGNNWLVNGSYILPRLLVVLMLVFEG